MMGRKHRNPTTTTTSKTLVLQNSASRTLKKWSYLLKEAALENSLSPLMEFVLQLLYV